MARITGLDTLLPAAAGRRAGDEGLRRAGIRPFDAALTPAQKSARRTSPVKGR